MWKRVRDDQRLLGQDDGLSAYRAARADKTVAGAGTLKLLVEPKGKARRKLNRAGRARVKAVVTYTPSGGPPVAQPKRVKLIKKR